MQEIKFLRPDHKGRISLGKLAEGVSGYRVMVDADYRIVLEPYAEIPAREKWLFDNPEALAAVKRGLQESHAGQTLSLGDFSA